MLSAASGWTGGTGSARTVRAAPGTADGAPGSLRDALLAANANNQNDVIVLRAGTYHLTAANLSNASGNNLQDNVAATGDLDVTEVNRLVVIQGQGAGLTIIDATGLNDRVFHILAGARLELRGVTVRGGVATEQGTPGVPNGSARGGGIFNAGGDLVLDRVKVNRNEARGRAGTASNGEGGGVHSTGSLFITASTIAKNLSVGAQGLQGSFSGVTGDFISVPGGQGLAGGLLVTSNSRAVVMNSTISGNKGIGGTGGLGAAGQSGVEGDVGGPGGAGGVGRGGGVAVRNGSELTLINSTVSSNRARGGLGGNGGTGFGGAADGNGGNGGDGQGGGIAVDGSDLTLFNTTVAFNATSTDAGGTGTVAGIAGQTLGGGLFVVDDNLTTLAATSTLFALNTATTGPDVKGEFETAVRCVLQRGGGAVGVANNDANGNRVGVQARLGPLALNGGPTATHALLAGSAALDVGSNPLGLAIDQRGGAFARVKGA